MFLAGLRRRIINGLVLLAAACVPVMGFTAPAKDMPLLVILSHHAAPYTEMAQAFKEHLREQKAQVTYIDITLDDKGEIPASFRETLASHKLALVYCLGAQAYKVAKAQAAGVPAVAGLMVNGEDIVRGGNSTGVALEFPIQTQLEWLKKILPQYKTIGVVYNELENKAKIEQAKATAKKLGLAFEVVGLQSPKELPAALGAIMRRVDVLWGLPDSIVLSPQTAKAILLASFHNRVPLIGVSSVWVKAGALYALDWDYQDMGVQTAEMALAILRGGSVAKVPVTSPRKIRYALNLKTAEHMKINLADELIAGAAQVIR
ncbi:MAG: ABC transporter substrate-binding protein [Gammaproteobacteria bacterium]